MRAFDEASLALTVMLYKVATCASAPSEPYEGDRPVGCVEALFIGVVEAGKPTSRDQSLSPRWSWDTVCVVGGSGNSPVVPGERVFDRYK